MSWTRQAIYTAIVLIGAFSISFLVFEWRKPDPGPIEDQLVQIQQAQISTVERDASGGVYGSAPTPYVSTTPFPGPTVELKRGTEVEYGGA